MHRTSESSSNCRSASANACTISCDNALRVSGWSNVIRATPSKIWSCNPFTSDMGGLKDVMTHSTLTLSILRNYQMNHGSATVYALQLGCRSTTLCLRRHFDWCHDD